jgi:hypothetical protein
MPPNMSSPLVHRETVGLVLTKCNDTISFHFIFVSDATCTQPSCEPLPLHHPHGFLVPTIASILVSFSFFSSLFFEIKNIYYT